MLSNMCLFISIKIQFEHYSDLVNHSEFLNATTIQVVSFTELLIILKLQKNKGGNSNNLVQRDCSLVGRFLHFKYLALNAFFVPYHFHTVQC